jgi:hypothetical protein
MKVPIGSALLVVLGVLASAACSGITARAAEARVTDPAPPGACATAISRLETALNEARMQGRVVASAPESAVRCFIISRRAIP